MKPITLKIPEALDGRLILPEEQVIQMKNMQRGYLGECEFVQLMRLLSCPHLLLRNLYFEPTFCGAIQIDFLLMVGNTVIIYEIKNYSGVWHHDEEVYRSGRMERTNPVIQLLRTKNNFKVLLRQLGYEDINVEAVVLHIGRNFTLLGASEERHVILPTQIEEHIDKLNLYEYPLSSRIKQLAQALQDCATQAPPFAKMIPDYSFESLKKGIRCKQCRDFVYKETTKKYTCKKCHYRGSISEAIADSIHTFKLLFPEMKVTSRNIMTWAGADFPLQRYQQVLKKMSSET